ncbi:hypothetical protein CF319_g6827 [Tilletia indica]|nr:hypothetical protein CF319_g6827 [Tilletia indica]
MRNIAHTFSAVADSQEIQHPNLSVNSCAHLLLDSRPSALPDSLRVALQRAELSYQHALTEVDILTQPSEAEQFFRLGTEVEEPENQVEVAITYYEGKVARAGDRTPIRIRRGDWKWSDAEFELVKHGLSE